MLRFRCPDRADDFDTRTRAARRTVQDKLDRGEAPASADFTALWRHYKEHFIRAQHGKCGYCEFDIAGNGYGDVDHYAPKTAYPRLAYEWTNYVYACDFCNRKHKGTQFPTATRSSRTSWRAVVDLETGEIALLLNPFERETNPADHLHFTRNGQIEIRAGSTRGRHTIRVYGLDREWLRNKRAPEAARAYQYIAELEDAVAREDLGGMDRVLDAIARAGAPDKRFAGMIRAIFEHEMDTRWEDAFLPD